MIDLPALHVMELGEHARAHRAGGIQVARPFIIGVSWRGRETTTTIIPMEMTKKGLMYHVSMAVVDGSKEPEWESYRLRRSWRLTSFWTEFARQANGLMAVRDVMEL